MFWFFFLEESYTRIMKYGDKQVNVKISINDIENMVSLVCLDYTSVLRKNGQKFLIPASHNFQIENIVR